MGAGTEKYAASAGLERQPAGRAGRRLATSGPPGPPRTACSTTRSSRSRSRSARATRSSSATDEGVRGDTTAESLGELRPAFDKAGNITAGNASQISDGGAAVIVVSKAKAEELGRHAARRDRRLRPGGRPRPVAAHPAGPGHQGRRPSARHATSATSTCSSSTRPSPPSAWPRWPTSASATTSSTSTAAPSPSATPSACPAPAWPSPSLLELGRRGGGLGAAALCGGGGQGDAILLKVG